MCFHQGITFRQMMYGDRKCHRFKFFVMKPNAEHETRRVVP